MKPKANSTLDGRLERLVGRVSRGDESAFADLYDATIAASFTLALALVGDRERAAQVVLAAYTEVWRTARNRDLTVSAHRWIMVVVLQWSGPSARGSLPTTAGPAARSRVIVEVANGLP